MKMIIKKKNVKLERILKKMTNETLTTMNKKVNCLQTSHRWYIDRGKSRDPYVVSCSV